MRARVTPTWRLLSLGVTLAGLSALAAPQVHGESFMVKVRPDTAPRASAPVELLAARNEAVSFQVVIHGGDSGAQGVTARFDALEGPARIESSQLTLYRQELLDITRPSGGSGGPGPWPDALIPAVDEVAGEARAAFPFDVPPKKARALWVDVLVPEDVPAGTYQGTVEVRAAGGFTARVPVVLTVVNALFPSTPSYPTAFGMESDFICEAHTGREDCGSDDVLVELTGRYARLALDHRFTLSKLLVLVPKDGQWERFDAAYAPFLDGTAPTRLRGARMTSAQYMGPLEDQAVASFVEHFAERGWLARAFDYTADEPPLFTTFEALRTRADILETSAPGLVRMVTTSLPHARNHGLEPLMSRMSVIIHHIAPTGIMDAGTPRTDYDTFLARPGTSLWLYQSCGSHGCGFPLPAGQHWPSYMVDHPANLNRAMPWVVFLLHASGETYYDTVARLSTAWTDQRFYGGNGDGTLFYPGTPERIGGQSHVPLPSIRLKLLRAGVQDYEWLMLVTRSGDPDFATQVARELIPAPDRVPIDPAAFERARARLIERALALGPPPAVRMAWHRALEALAGVAVAAMLPARPSLWWASSGS
ncbi:glycoside hydrolase domain-containing protein [Pyxidicoccus sp. 3LG]